VAPGNRHGIDTPAFAGTTAVTGHAPTEANPRRYHNCWYVHHSREKTARIAAPCLTACNRAASISSDCAIITSADETAANIENVLKRGSAIGARLKHTAIEADIRIDIGGFEIEVLSE